MDGELDAIARGGSPQPAFEVSSAASDGEQDGHLDPLFSGSPERVVGRLKLGGSKIAEQIFKDLVFDMFDRPVMGNLYRPHFVERMIMIGLGEEFRLTSGDWASWDIEHATSRFRIEVKQSAALQSWTRPPPDGKPGKGSFDIAPRTGYWIDGGRRWIKWPGRIAHVYVMAWHPVQLRQDADQRDPCQWRFFVVPTAELEQRIKSWPKQKSISRKVIEVSRRWEAVGFEELRAKMLDTMGKILSSENDSARGGDEEPGYCRLQSPRMEGCVERTP